MSNNSGNNCRCQRVGTTCKLRKWGGGGVISVRMSRGGYGHTSWGKSFMPKGCDNQ